MGRDKRGGRKDQAQLRGAGLLPFRVVLSAYFVLRLGLGAGVTEISRIPSLKVINQQGQWTSKQIINARKAMDGFVQKLAHSTSERTLSARHFSRLWGALQRSKWTKSFSAREAYPDTWPQRCGSTEEQIPATPGENVGQVTLKAGGESKATELRG